MIVCFISWGQYDGFKDAVKCAEALAGWPVHVVSEFLIPCQNQHRIQDYPAHHLMKSLQQRTGDNRWTYIVRWLVLRDFINAHPDLGWPVFCADWDVLIMRDLNQSYAPFLQDDYTVSIHDEPPFPQSAAYCINQLGPLNSFCELVERLLKETPLPVVDDMALWARMQHENPFWKVGDLNVIRNGSVFDHNMHTGKARFHMDGPAKKIEWVGKKPAFRTSDGLVRANTIHAWGSYKTRTGEMLRKAGL